MILDAHNTTVCFSISHVLAAPYKHVMDDHETFVQTGVVVTASKIRQFIFPGVVELMQLLFEAEHVKVAFFDDEEERKTKEFVEMLLSYALGPKRYEEVRKSVIILSKKSLSVDTLEAYKHQAQHFGFTQSFLKKNTLSIEERAARSDAVLLIDKTPAYVAAGREESFFCAPKTVASAFVDLDLGAKECTPIDFYFVNMSSMRGLLAHRKNIITHKYILVGCIDSKCYIFYTNEKTNELYFYTFSEEDNEVLKEHFPKQEGLYSRQRAKVHSPFLVALLLTKITQYHGKIDKLSRRLNHVYFITGAIFEAMRIAAIERKPVSKVFFSWQFRETKGVCESLFDEFHANEHLYYIGLELLRKKNPDLKFLRAHNSLSQDAAADLESD